MKFFDALRKHSKKIDLTVKICATVLTFVFAIIATAHPIMFENSAAINRAFNVQTTRQETIETDEEIDSEYFKSEHTSVASVRQAGLDMIEEVMSEGATLLKNDNNALPLAKGSKVALQRVVGRACYCRHGLVGHVQFAERRQYRRDDL